MIISWWGKSTFVKRDILNIVKHCITPTTDCNSLKWIFGHLCCCPLKSLFNSDILVMFAFRNNKSSSPFSLFLLMSSRRKFCCVLSLSGTLIQCAWILQLESINEFWPIEELSSFDVFYFICYLITEGLADFLIYSLTDFSC